MRPDVGQVLGALRSVDRAEGERQAPATAVVRLAQSSGFTQSLAATQLPP